MRQRQQPITPSSPPSSPIRAHVQEMPGDIDYINLGRMIIPLELNYCQCMLELEEYYEVIEHTDELLHKHKGKPALGMSSGRSGPHCSMERAALAGIKHAAFRPDR